MDVSTRSFLGKADSENKRGFARGNQVRSPLPPPADFDLAILEILEAGRPGRMESFPVKKMPRFHPRPIDPGRQPKGRAGRWNSWRSGGQRTGIWYKIGPDSASR